jgi:hypothetical protein
LRGSIQLTLAAKKLKYRHKDISIIFDLNLDGILKSLQQEDRDEFANEKQNGKRRK